MIASSLFNRISGILFGNAEFKPQERKFLTLICLLTLLYVCVTTVIDAALGLPFNLILILNLTNVLIALMLVAALKYQNNKVISILFRFFAVSLLPLSWFLNEGYNGNGVAALLIYFIILYSITPKNSQKVVFWTFLIYITGLVVIQYLRPDLAISFENDQQRFANILVSGTILFLFLYFFINLTIENNKLEYEKVQAANRKLELLNKELLQKTIQLEESNLESRENRELYQNMITNSPLGMHFYEVNEKNELVFTNANPSAEKLLGFPKQNFVGKTIQEAFPPLIKTEIPQRYLEAALYNKSWSTEQIEVKADKISGAFEVTAFQTTPGKMVALFSDITDRKNAEEQILQLSKGIEQSPISVVITDKEGNIEYVNPKFCENTGYSIDEVIGKNPRIVKSGRHNKEFFKHIWDTITAGNIWTGELLNKKYNGELFWESTSISPITNEKGEIIKFIAVKEDITEKKKMRDELIEAKDSAEKANQLKSEFLAQISHEIRSPINAIYGLTSVIKDGFKYMDEDEMNYCFSGIDSASKRVIRTIDSIINMSQLHLGTYELHVKPVDIKTIIENLHREYSKVVNDKNLMVSIKINTDNTEILSDEYAVNQILNNIIDNAVKYTEQGKIDITVKREGKTGINLSIKDTGKGISEEYLPKLFDPFSQEEQGYTRRYDGNGLGLSLVKKYSELINGYIEIQSWKGKGTEVIVRIPDSIEIAGSEIRKTH